jgi:hypothetical protein
MDKINMKDFLASELSEEPNMDACVKALARELAERETSASICSSYVRNIMATFPEESYMEKLVGEWSNPSKMFRILVGASRSDRREVLRKFQQLLGPKNSKFDLKTFLEDHSFPIPSELISAQWIKAADEGDGNVIGCEYNTKEVIELFSKSVFTALVVLLEVEGGPRVSEWKTNETTDTPTELTIEGLMDEVKFLKEQLKLKDSHNQAYMEQENGKGFGLQSKMKFDGGLNRPPHNAKPNIGVQNKDTNELLIQLMERMERLELGNRKERKQPREKSRGESSSSADCKQTGKSSKSRKLKSDIEHWSESESSKSVDSDGSDSTSKYSRL